MPIPEKTSAEAFEQYVGGTCVREGRGSAWRNLKAWIIEPPREADMVPLPAVTETSLACTISGEAEFKEREKGKPWITHRLQRGSMFLTSGGAPYDCRWKAISPEPFLTLMVFLELPLLQRAFEEVFRGDAHRVRLRDLSAFSDATLNGYMETVRQELMRRRASPLLVQGVAQAMAIHLARNYAATISGPQRESSALPGYKLKHLTKWMGARLDRKFDLDALAAEAGLSKFHFHRLFKTATGMTPARYQQMQRLDAARRLLRETKKSIVEIGIEVGIENPSHFAQVFRREVGLAPSAFRRQA